MKKTLISLAIAAGMVASGAAFAGDVTVYGNVHVSIDDIDKSLPSDEIQMNSNTSSFGVKGSEDLGDGMKALFKIEWQVDPTERDKSITDRDQWVGIKGGMGTAKFGTMSNNWKQTGSKVDPMYRTRLEGRGALNMQSGLHGGAGRLAGRMTDTVQLSSSKMGGMQMIFNTTFDGAQTSGDTSTPVSIDETIGLGFRYATKKFSVHFDYIDQSDEMDDPITGLGLDVTGSESATKIGGKFKAGPVTIGAQFEQTEDLVGGDYTFLSANYKVSGNTNVAVSVGQFAAKAASSDTSAVAVMYNHKLGKKTNVYVGYGDRSDDAAGSQGESITTFGIRKKF
jgi:predicted porin